MVSLELPEIDRNTADVCVRVCVCVSGEQTDVRACTAGQRAAGPFGIPGPPSPPRTALLHDVTVARGATRLAEEY